MAPGAVSRWATSEPDSIVTSWRAPTAALALRSGRGLLRQPQSTIPGIVFPLFFAAVNTAALDRTRGLEGFPSVNSFLSFLLPATLIQGVMLSSTTAGNDVAIDLQNGFFDRLLASPVNRLSLLLGRLAGATAYAAVLAVVFQAILVVFGARIEAGIAGALVIVVMAALFGAGIGAFSMAIGFRTGSVEEVNGYFPIFFALVFVSSAFFPPELVGGWFARVADLNPVSWMINGARHQVIFGWDTVGALQAVGVAAGIAVVFVALAVLSLRSRLAQ